MSGQTLRNIRVCIFEDNNSLRNGLSMLINGSAGFECVGAYENCSDVVNIVGATNPDVLLMDIQMPGLNGIDAVRLVRQHYPNQKILMQTVFEDEDKIFRSICAGASGYILKSTSAWRILDYIRETFEGGAPMSPSVATRVLTMLAQQSLPQQQDFDLSIREKEVLSCLVKGMSYKLIAETCFISLDTVRGHIRNIYDKLHVHSKGEAIAKALQAKIV